MKKLSILFVIMILFSGCARLRTSQEPHELDRQDNFVQVARIGIFAVMKNNSLVINQVLKDFPAELAGVKLGDTIVSVDGNNVTNQKEIASLINNKRPGDHVLLVIRRNLQIFNFDIEPKITKLRPTGIKIISLLQENKKVTMAIIVSEVKNTFPNAPNDWADSIRNDLLSQEEGKYLAAYGNNENFAIVDRSRLSQILDEFKLNQVGLVSDKARAKIGEMTGATHILDISFSRYREANNIRSDVYNGRLIEIVSGKVLAVDNIRIRYGI